MIRKKPAGLDPGWTRLPKRSCADAKYFDDGPTANASTGGFGMRAGAHPFRGGSLAAAGYVRVNGARINAPGRMVRAGDIITVALDRAVRVLKVRGFAERRGAAAAGQDFI